MMWAEAVEVACYAEDGVVVIAFDLSGSSAGYLMIQLPQTGGGMEDEFFEANHYVEVQDQHWGRFGGLAALRFVDDRQLQLKLGYEVEGIGNAITIRSSAPFPEAVITQLNFIGLPEE